jgi:hypothetical protein
MPILSRLLPFLLLGMFIVMLVVGLILLWYLLIFGAIVGLFLFALAWIREKFFTPKDLVPYKKNRKESNRTIDHEDK